MSFHFYVAHPGPPLVLSFGEMMEYLRSLLETGTDVKVDGSSLLQNQATQPRRACLFLGMLEMARDQQVQIEQNEGFGRIWLTRGLPRP
jgi:chromatin segregation and condensation protein Rec8/ScpA/Scc1 (kleisin family)